MSEATRQTRTHLMDLFAQLKLNPRTDLGQNFLIDLNVLEFIVKSAELTRRDVILEVGSGTGSMTAQMAATAAAVITVEIDANMAALAGMATAGMNNVTIINRDILKNKNTLAPEVVNAVREALAAGENRQLKLVANLPYHVATPVVSNLVASDLPWERMVVTIQLELAQRMAANPGGGTYGALSVWLQSQCHVRFLKRLRPQVFWPRPGVQSAIVRLLPAVGKSGPITNRPFLQNFLRLLFAQRRKLVRPVLASMYRKQLTKADVDALLAELKIPEKTRAETMQPYELVRLGNRFYEAIKSTGQEVIIKDDDAGEEE